MARLHVPPGPSLRGEPVTVTVDGLAPGQSVVVDAEGMDRFGGRWRSRSTFQAGPDGAVDLSRDAPVTGGYSVAAREGIFSSMALDPGARVQTPMVAIDEVALTLRDAAGRELDRTAVAWTGRGDLSEIPLGGELRGTLFVPAGAGRRRALVVLGGSEGGSRDDLAALLATRLQVPALALAYFRVPGSPLPAALREIPLEYFGRALDWLDARPEVTPGGAVLLGISRGAELALLLASTWPARIGGVAASVPSAVAWPGEADGPPAPAWTHEGRPVPSVPIAMTEAQLDRLGQAAGTGEPYAFRPVYEGSLAAAPPAVVEAATLPVERIGGPVLLVGSGMDGVWPSDLFVHRIAERLARRGFPHPVTALTYPSSGHLVQDGYQPTTLTHTVAPGSPVVLDLGGTPAGSAAASADSWPRTLDFLAAALHRP